MPNEDFARVTAAGRTFTIDGKDYRASKLTPRGVGDLQAYLKEVIPDPRRVARDLMDGFPESVQLEILRRAYEEAREWPPEFGDPKTFHLFLSEEGQARLLWVCFRKHNPSFTLDYARELSRRYEMDIDELNHLMELVSPGEVGDVKNQTRAMEQPTKS